VVQVRKGNPINNPATRLHVLITRLKQIPPSNPCASSFAAVLEVPAANNFLLLERIGRLMTLARRAKEQALACEVSTSDPHLEWVPAVEHAFMSFSLGGNLATFTEKIDAVTLQQLRFCGILIGARFGEPDLAKEEAVQLVEEIEELIKEIGESSIDESVRQYALRHLLQIAQALREYHLFGAERIREEVSAAIGSAFFHQEEARSAGEGYWIVIDKVFDKVCTLVQTGAAVAVMETFRRSLLGH
jgi:hypothetical protein